MVAGSCEREGAPGAVGVEDWGGRVRERSERPGCDRDWVGVPARPPEYSLPPRLPLTLVRLVPAAARSCCWAGVSPDTPPPPPPRLSRELLMK